MSRDYAAWSRAPRQLKPGRFTIWRLRCYLEEDNLTPARDVQTDICVVGDGPAGIAFTREYIGASLHVTLLETGHFEKNNRAEALSVGNVQSSGVEPARGLAVVREDSASTLRLGGALVSGGVAEDDGPVRSGQTPFPL